jgi:hypothetical protein
VAPGSENNETITQNHLNGAEARGLCF